VNRILHDLGVIIGLLLWVSCVPHVEIEGSPCPCPGGYMCCELLFECIDEQGTCPDSYPPSSATPCLTNDDCPKGEVCQAWSMENGSIGGPKTCRRDCSSGFSCASTEVCKLALQDGTLLADLNVARMCTTEAPLEGCKNDGCLDCEISQLGQTFCEDKGIHGCFLGIHPVCGLTCSSSVVQACGYAGCMDSGGSTCNSQPIVDPCVEFSCSACPNPGVPMEHQCENSHRVVGCLVAAFAGDSCNSICQTVSWECSEPSSCVEENAAHCR
jgi:hypothetical protein